MRNIYCELSEDKKSIVLGSGWEETTGKLNQLGLITKREDSAIYLDFEFKNSRRLTKSSLFVRASFSISASIAS